MFLIDFKHRQSQAFLHGFVKGLAAPIMLFNVEGAPGIPRVDPVALPQRTDREALAGDWRRVGDDLRAVITRHGEAA